MKPSLYIACCLFVLTVHVWPCLADDPVPPKTLLTKPGQLLFRDDLQAAPDKKEWRYGPGSWSIVDGALKGLERAEDMHGAVLRKPIQFHDAVIRFDFKLDGTRQTTLSINDSKEHVCRVLLRPAGFTVQKDDHDHQGPDKAVIFETKQTPLKAGEWHTVIVELRGPELVATVDGKQTGFGSHEMLDCEKANFGFTVAGDSASFRKLTVWKALPNLEWEMTKAELTKNRDAVESRSKAEK
jgi:hypothetical protein